MTARTECRLCFSKAPLRDVLSLGDIIPVDFVPVGRPVRDPAPLTLCECEGCGLIQLRHMLDRDTLFREYWYESALNPTMVAALRDVVAGVLKRVAFETGDSVIDIGANDGTLLSMYDELWKDDIDVTTIGFDPAHNLSDKATEACDRFENDYFETSTAKLPQAKAITSIAMFYDLDDPRTFVRKIAAVLHHKGVWVMQMTDLVRMLRANAFDNICHEHVCYYSLAIFSNLVNYYGLEVFDVEFNDVNGGSIRAYVGHDGQHEIMPTVKSALEDEAAFLADRALDRFSAMVELAKTAIVDYVISARAEGKTVHVLGASTKGNTLLQYFGLTHVEIEAASDVNPAKEGLRMAGSNVPIISESASIAAKPDMYLVLPWHFIRFFLGTYEQYMKDGGELVVPLPIPTQFRMRAMQDPERSAFTLSERRLVLVHG